MKGKPHLKTNFPSHSRSNSLSVWVCAAGVKHNILISWDCEVSEATLLNHAERQRAEHTQKPAEHKHASSFLPADIDRAEGAIGGNITWQPPG